MARLENVRSMLQKDSRSEIAAGVAMDYGFKVVHAGPLRAECQRLLHEVERHPEKYTVDTLNTLNRIISSIGPRKHFMLKVDALGGYESKTVEIEGFATVKIKSVKLQESE